MKKPARKILTLMTTLAASTIGASASPSPPTKPASWVDAHSTTVVMIDSQPYMVTLDRLLRDEGQHAKIGAWFLAWADDQLGDGDRRHLAGVALDAIAVYRPLWRGRCEACEAPAALGGTPVASHAALIVDAVRTRVAEPLERQGIAIDRGRLDELLAA